MWHLRITTLPLFIDALSMVLKIVPNYVSEIAGARQYKSLSM